jgi:hypothetical protein
LIQLGDGGVLVETIAHRGPNIAMRAIRNGGCRRKWRSEAAVVVEVGNRCRVGTVDETVCKSTRNRCRHKRRHVDGIPKRSGWALVLERENSFVETNVAAGDNLLRV